MVKNLSDFGSNCLTIGRILEHIKTQMDLHKFSLSTSFSLLKHSKTIGLKCGMTGDGVNDAPTYEKGTVFGIAVAGARMPQSCC